MKALSIILLALIPATTLMAQSAEEIITRMERNQVHDTSRMEGRLIINDRFGSRTSSFISYARGADDALIEFTSAGERGQKVLRTRDEVYLFYPDAAELIRLQGAALRDSMLGSDVSYEDMTGNRALLDNYRVSLDGEETINDHPTFRVKLEARGRNVAYPRQTIWVDRELFVMRRAEQFSANGRLLKEVEVKETMEVSGLTFPSRMVIRDVLKRNSSTEFVIDKAEVNISLPRNVFSLESLRW
ncbi:MAG: outer membrane lipoprotein-sorting protein [Spirochaetaceae bacterium]|nr:MAG: outer membrane lipoprotein-sorting protein [Spirochaetaceae bacterium]